MASHPDVSLIVPTFQMADCVGDAIESALAQSVGYAQIIVVDDGSTDGTQDVLRGFGEKIRFLRQENRGVSVARNTGLEIATGEFVAFLDADDLLLPDCLAAQLGLFADHPETEFCDAFASYFWCPRMTAKERAADHRLSHDFWRQSFPGHISTWLIRREVMARVGPFEAGVAYSEDTDWRLRARTAGVTARRLDREVSRRRLHKSNATNRDRTGNVRGLMQAIRKNRARMARRQAEART